MKKTKRSTILTLAVSPTLTMTLKMMAKMAHLRSISLHRVTWVWQGPMQITHSLSTCPVLSPRFSHALPLRSLVPRFAEFPITAWLWAKFQSILQGLLTRLTSLATQKVDLINPSTLCSSSISTRCVSLACSWLRRIKSDANKKRKRIN